MPRQKPQAVKRSSQGQAEEAAPPRPDTVKAPRRRATKAAFPLPLLSNGAGYTPLSRIVVPLSPGIAPTSPTLVDQCTLLNFAEGAVPLGTLWWNSPPLLSFVEKLIRSNILGVWLSQEGRDSYLLIGVQDEAISKYYSFATSRPKEASWLRRVLRLLPLGSSPQPLESSSISDQEWQLAASPRNEAKALSVKFEPPEFPAIFRTTLRQFQHEAVTWMIAREKGLVPNSNVYDKAWEDAWQPLSEVTPSDSPFFVNVLSGDFDDQRPQIPPGVRGGILADEVSLANSL